MFAPYAQLHIGIKDLPRLQPHNRESQAGLFLSAVFVFNVCFESFFIAPRLKARGISYAAQIVQLHEYGAAHFPARRRMKASFQPRHSPFD